MHSYFYNTLNQNEKKNYDNVVKGMKSCDRDIPMTTKLPIDELVSFLLYDNPDIFYVDKYYEKTMKLGRVLFRPKYLYKGTELEKMRKKIEAKAAEIISQCINSHQSDYDKAMVLHDYLKKNITYNHAALNKKSIKGFENSYNLVGALIERCCVCAGFSAAYKYLCDKAGVECIVITGVGRSAVFSGEHAWNIVKINGYYHHVDVTWDNQFSDDETVPNYGYFCLSDETISRDHTWDKRKFPACPDEPYNYFRVNNSIIDTKVQLVRFLTDYISNEEETVMFKVKRGSQLETEILSVLEDSVFSAAAKCKYVNVNSFKYCFIPEQLVYCLYLSY